MPLLRQNVDRRPLSDLKGPPRNNVLSSKPDSDIYNNPTGPPKQYRPPAFDERGGRSYLALLFTLI